MLNKVEFKNKITEFINGDKQVVLVKGYVNEFKLLTVLSCLNVSDYKKGTIHARSIGNLKEISAQRVVPKKITQNKNFNISNLTLQVNLYEQKNIQFGDVAIYYPVQTAIMFEKDTDKLINHIKSNSSLKIFIITTNDWGFTTEKLEQISDELIIFDLKQEDSEKYEILYRNSSGNLPY